MCYYSSLSFFYLIDNTYKYNKLLLIWQKCMVNYLIIFVNCWCPFLQIHIQKPMSKKAQWKAMPKGPPRRPKSKRGPKKEMQGKAIYSRIQICHRIQLCRRIQFFGKMTSADKDKLSPRPFWSSQHYLAHKGLNSFVLKIGVKTSMKKHGERNKEQQEVLVAGNAWRKSQTKGNDKTQQETREEIIQPHSITKQS